MPPLRSFVFLMLKPPLSEAKASVPADSCPASRNAAPTFWEIAGEAYSAVSMLGMPVRPRVSRK
jgi:hypothetical protein